MFIVLLSFSESLASKYLSLNDKLCMFRPTVIDLNTIELKYYTFMISLEWCNGSCNDLSSKICVLKKTKDIKVKVFNMITNKNKAKTMEKHNSCDCKRQFNSTKCNSNQKWNSRIYQCEVFKIFCWYFSDCLWWNYICYGYWINKNDKYYTNKCYEYCFNKL